MDTCKLSIAAIIAGVTASASASADTIPVNDLIALLEQNPVQRVDYNQIVMSSEQGGRSSSITKGGEMPLDVYDQSTRPVIGGGDGPAASMVFDNRSKSIWFFDDQGAFEFVAAVNTGIETIDLFRNGDIAMSFPYDRVIEGDFTPLDADPQLQMPPEFEGYAAITEGMEFEQDFSIVPTGSRTGPQGLYMILGPEERMFIWRPFDNASQILLWELINHEEAHNLQIIDFADFASALGVARPNE